MINTLNKTIIIMMAALFLTANTGFAADRFIVLASTTSTANSGLFDHVLPKFQKETGIEVRVVAVGTGQAIRLARNGDADVLLVHHKASEEAFVAEGLGIKRHNVMYNDFVIVGPKADPSGVGQATELSSALLSIAFGSAPFVSRGDESGTHIREKSLWKDINVEPGQNWYRQTGTGMGTTLNIAAAMGAYTLSDRATWLAFENKAEMALLFEGDRSLFNQYGIIAVNPAKFPHVKAAEAKAFVDWILSPNGQAAIGAYRRGGEQLFFPNAGS